VDLDSTPHYAKSIDSNTNRSLIIVLFSNFVKACAVVDEETENTSRMS
jgi:hypothetical protein